MSVDDVAAAANGKETCFQKRYCFQLQLKLVIELVEERNWIDMGHHQTDGEGKGDELTKEEDG